MRSIEDKMCTNNGSTQESSGGSCMNFEFQKSNGVVSRSRTSLGPKPTPSKWDDAQKWLVNLSRGEKNQPKASPRNSNADDRRLIAAPVPKKEYPSDEGENGCLAVVTKNVDCDESTQRNNRSVNSSNAVVRSICLRDMGTDMTPIASQEPSRAATPIRAASPASRSPMTSGSSAPVIVKACKNIGIPCEASGSTREISGDDRELDCVNVENENDDQAKKVSPLETRALAWDEAERAKYMARYKREEVKIQAWENHQKRKAEMENRKVEVKAERLKSRAKEKYNSRIAATRRIAEEKRANAEAKLNEKAMITSERADYIRRTGHLPSSLSFKLPSCCW